MLCNDKYIKCEKVEENKTSSGIYFVEEGKNSNIIKGRIIDNGYDSSCEADPYHGIYEMGSIVICLRNRTIEASSNTFYIKKKFVLEIE